MRDRKYYVSRNTVFIISSLIMFLIFYKVPILGDDVVNYQHRSDFNTIAKSTNYVINQYNWWSSRTIVNFFMYLFSTHNIFWFALVTALLIFLLQRSLSTIFNRSSNFYLDIGICLLVLMIPFPYFSTAGWIATTTTYLWPIILGVYSVIPLLLNDYMNPCRYILATLATIYAANNEQVMIILLLLYVSAIILSFTRIRKVTRYCYLQFGLIIIELLYFVACPGNETRKQLETKTWFPIFGRLTFIDKVDIGFMTTGEHLLFGNIIVVLVLVAFLFYIHKFKRNIVYSLSAINLCLVCVAGLAFDIFIVKGRMARFFSFPKLGLLKELNIYTISQFVAYLLFITLVIITYYYQQNISQYIMMMALFLGALLARMALGFSPTAYVSATRTFAVLSMSIMIMCIPPLSKILLQQKKVLVPLAVLSAINLSVFCLQISGVEVLKYLPLWTQIW